MDYIKKLTPKLVEKILAKGVRDMPQNPSAQGYDERQIRGFYYIPEKEILGVIMEIETTLSQVFTYIKNSKVNVSDVIDNLLSEETTKPLSAKQGAVLDGKISDVNEIINKIIEQVNDIDSELSTESEKPVQNKVIAEAFEGKLDKITTIGNYPRVYAIARDGANIILEVADGHIAPTSALAHYYGSTTGYGDREPQGVLITGTPKRDYHATPKKYVDDILAGKVDITDLDNYDNKTQVKDALNKKLNNSGDEIFDGNLSITGDLNIAGSTHTINQETLTIKDNFIAINGEGTTLETAGSAGVIVMSGKEQTVMANGIYVLDIEALCELIEVDTEAYDEAPWSEPFGAYRIIFKNDIFADLNYLYVSCIANDTSGYLGLSGGGTEQPMLAITPGLYDFATFDSEGNIKINPSNLIWEYEINNQFVLPKHIEILCKIFKHEDGTPVTSDDFSIQNQAYAAPIYDVNDDSLKIGLGTYKKDEKGNIISFVFGAGQGQSITTRADNIQDGHLVKWDATKNKLVDAGTGLTEEEKNKFVKNTDYATSTKGGIAKLISAFGIGINENGVAYLTACDYGILNSQADGFRAVTPRYFAYGVKQALINPEISLNPANWTDEERAKARQTLGISGSGGGGAKVYKHSIVIMGDYASSGYPTVIEVLSYSSSLASSYLNYIRLPKLCCIGGCAYYNDVYGDMYFSDVFGNKGSGVLGWYDWENGDGTEFKEDYTEYDFSQHINDTWTDTVTEYKGG